MAALFAEIDETLGKWLQAQPMFFVGTAPSGDGGHVNLSPKGDMRTFAVLGPHRVAYVDLFGSGVETVAHVRQNGRVTLMFCAFAGKPRIVRLYGKGTVLELSDERAAALLPRFEISGTESALRSMVVVDVTRIAESCGYGVPRMDVGRDRYHALYDIADQWVETHGPTAIQDYCAVNGVESIDGIPAFAPRSEVTDEMRRRHDAAGRRL